MTLIGYRKFITAMASIASSTSLVACGLISDGIYSTVMLAAIGIFALANVTQKAVAK